MTTEPREPSIIPIRGAIATVGTAGALTLLLSFQGGPLAPSGSATAADEQAAVADDPAVLAIEPPATDTAAGEFTLEPVTYTGEAISTRWGDVQVEVTLEGGDITEVVALQLPADDDHTSDISDYVGPILREEAIASDSADVSVISGATYTSEAYATSLQSALDQAGAGAAPVVDEPEVVVEEAIEEPAPQEGDEMRTATGEAVAIRWGDVQVAVTVDGDDIIDVEALAIPLDDRKSENINSRAEPLLREEAIAADSAEVSVVSGATYTSQAYAQSLQSALDQLGL